MQDTEYVWEVRCLSNYQFEEGVCYATEREAERVADELRSRNVRNAPYGTRVHPVTVTKVSKVRPVERRW